jgi:hypothetical protein
MLIGIREGASEGGTMEVLNLIGSICSILALLVALFVAVKVQKIDNSIRVRGDRNLVAGRDITPR